MSETINSTSIQLSWDRPSTPNGIITHYSLMYNVVDGPLFDPVLLDDTMFTVNNLNEHTEYEFSVAAATGAGLGPPAVTSSRTAEDGMYIHVCISCIQYRYLNVRFVRLVACLCGSRSEQSQLQQSPILFRASPITLETYFSCILLMLCCVHSFSAPSAGVQELRGVFSSSTSLNISWLPPPPDDQNGIIRAYNVSYGLTTQSRDEYVSVATNQSMIELTSLEIFTEYEVVVSPFTIAIGPEESVTVQTDSDRELRTEV